MDQTKKPGDEIVLAITIFNGIDGLKFKHFWNPSFSRRRDIDLSAAYFILDTDHVQLRPDSTQKLFLICRKNTPFGILTWIGLYSGLPDFLLKRSGDYCGVGIWLLNSKMRGNDVVAFLRAASSKLYREIEDIKYKARWNIEETDLRILGLTSEDIENEPDQPINDQKSLGFESVCIDLRQPGHQSQIGKAIENVQASQQFINYRKILLTDTDDIIEDVRTRGNVAVIKFDGSALVASDNLIKPVKTEATKSLSLGAAAQGSFFDSAGTNSMRNDIVTKYALEDLEERLNNRLKVGESRNIAWKQLTMAALGLYFVCILGLATLVAHLEFVEQSWRLRDVASPNSPQPLDNNNKGSSETTGIGGIRQSGADQTGPEPAKQPQRQGPECDPKQGCAPATQAAPTQLELEAAKLEQGLETVISQTQTMLQTNLIKQNRPMKDSLEKALANTKAAKTTFDTLHLTKEH